MAARDLRYKWFRKISEQYAYSSLATAHHFDDSIETILLNLTKGSGVDGLTGIPVRNGQIIRPLLFATRAQIERYAREKNISWREDQSNLTDDYQRNFIRHNVIPKLRELNPSLASTWQHGVDKIQGDLAFLRQAYDNWKNEYIEEATDKIIIQKRGFENLSIGASLLWRYIKTYSFNFDQASEIISARDGQPGKRFLSPTHMLVIDRDTFIISPCSLDWNAINVKLEDHEVTLGPWKLYLSMGAVTIYGLDKMEAAVDADALKFPLVWRRWKNGDSFHPLGMSHKKKLSDFFVDNKLSIIEKKSVTVLESDGNIVYVVGWRIDDRFKITETTKRILHIQAAKA